MEDQGFTSLRFEDRRRPTRKERENIEAHGHARAGLADNRGSLAKGIRNDRHIMVTGRQVHCQRPKLYQDRSRVLRGAAFAYIRVNRHDIRPELLTLAGGQSHDLPRVLVYCRNYMRVACERGQLGVSIDLQDRIAARALQDWLYESLAQIQKAQAKQLHVRNCDFGLLYGIVAQMLKRRYREACEKLSGTRKRAPGVEWNYGLEKVQPIDARMTMALPAKAMAAYKPHALPILHLRIEHENIQPSGADIGRT